MNLTIKLSLITPSFLCLSLHCAEKQPNSDKIISKSFSTGTPIGQRNTHIRVLQTCINQEKPVPAEIIFSTDNDIAARAFHHNRNLSDGALFKKSK